MTVSALVPVKNEAPNLRSCLEHLGWCDEVFVVDSGSDDETVAVAESMGANVVQFHYHPPHPKKKNWALANLPFRNDWVLIVDADEIIPKELADEILEKVDGSGPDGYFINRRFYFLGHWLKHCGYYPSYNLRLFKHRLGKYERIDAEGAGDNEVHEHVVLDGKTRYLDNDMLHYAYPDISTWLQKHNRYSNWEAASYVQQRDGDEGTVITGRELARKRLLKRVYLRIPLRFLLRFPYSYFWKRGFLDGWPGFIMCGLLSFYDFLTWSKARELRLTYPTRER